jgi:hypothetical protein
MKKGENGEKKINPLASWDMVCQPKKKGGLGILNLKIQNHGLLLKYLHKFYNREDTPWVDLIWSTYYTEKVPHAVPLCGSFWWKDICILMPIYRGIASILVNDGASTLFGKIPGLQPLLVTHAPEPSHLQLMKIFQFRASFHQQA